MSSLPCERVVRTNRSRPPWCLCARNEKRNHRTELKLHRKFRDRRIENISTTPHLPLKVNAPPFTPFTIDILPLLLRYKPVPFVPVDRILSSAPPGNLVSSDVFVVDVVSPLLDAVVPLTRSLCSWAPVWWFWLRCPNEYDKQKERNIEKEQRHLQNMN